MSINDTIIQQLLYLGFSQYESKCYWAVLNNPGIVGKEISSLAEVPISKVYGVLQTLCDKGILRRKSQGSKGYIAIPLKDVYEKQANRLEYSYETLKKTLNKNKNLVSDEIIWNINGYTDVMLHAKRMIKSAQRSILIAADEMEIKCLIDELIEAEASGVDVLLITTSSVPVPLKNVFRHEQEGEAKWNATKGNCTQIIIDSLTVFLGTIDFNNKPATNAIYTENSLILRIAKDRMIHEIYIARIFDKFREVINNEFGDGLDFLAQEYFKY